MTSHLDEEEGWSAAEERVGSLYRALGFTVTRDVVNRGSQIDLVAERRDPVVGRIRIAVEVKDHPGASTPIQEVRDFLNNAHNALRRADFDKVHLVTSGKVTRQSRAEVDAEAHIRVLTFDELERELLQPDAALQQWLDTYGRDPIRKRFVDVTATLRGPAPVGSARTSIPSTELLDVALKDPALGLVVLADYGSGKSTMLQRIKAHAIRRRSADPSAVVPILIELRDVTAEFDIEQVALGACLSELGIQLPADSFWSLLRHGRFLILLDGFDEITLHASATTREQMLARISPLLFGPSPAILTSRPSYFASFEEYRLLLTKMRGDRPPNPGAAPDELRVDRHADMLAALYVTKGPKVAIDSNAVTYLLDPLTSGQIDLFLEQAADDLAAAGTNPKEVRGFLDSVYDLSDLISRPIILDMAVASTVEGVITPSQRTLQDGPSGLYEAYARVRLKRDWLSVESRQELLSHDIRMRFAEECALYMDRNDVLRVEPSAIAEVAARTLSLGTGEDLEGVLTDLRTCSFLTIGDSGALEFIHRSYQEFFVARRIRAQLARNDTSRLRKELRWEYAYFLGAMGYTNSDAYKTFTELALRRQSGNELVADNAAQAVLIAREVARDLDWHDRTISELRRPRTQISDSALLGVMLRGLRVDQVDLTECKLDATISAGEFGAIGIGNLTVTNCTGKLNAHGRIGQLDVHGGDLEVSVSRDVGPVSLESTNLRLRSDSKRHAFRYVTGRAEIGASTVAVEASDLWITSSEPVDGTISDSLIDIDLDGWKSIAASLTRTAVVVHGVRPAATAFTATRRSKRVLDEAPAGTGSVIVVDPSVLADRWWGRQMGLVTVGAQITDARTHMPGLFVYEQATPAKATPRPGSVTFWIDTDTVVMEGWGENFTLACERLSKVVAKAAARSVGNGSWLVNGLCPLLVELGCPSGAVDRLRQLVAVRVTNAGPNSPP